MNLEYLTALASFVLGVGFVGLMVRREPWALIFSAILIAGSVLISLAGFSSFWMNDEGASAIPILSALLSVQIFATFNFVMVRKT